MEKPRYYLPLLFLFLLITGYPVKGQELTLSQAIALILKVNPELQSLQNQVRAKEGAHIQAGAIPNPDIGGIGGNRTQMIEFGQTIEYPGRRKTRVNQTGEEVQIATFELKQAQIEMAAQVAALFFDALWVERNVEQLQENLSIAERFLDAARAKFDQGFGSKLDVVKGQVEVVRARRLLIGARQEFLSTQQELKLFLKRNRNDSLQFSGDLSQSFFAPDANLDSLLAFAYRSHPSLAAEEHKLKAAQFGVLAAGLSTKPDFNFTLAGGREEEVDKIEVGLSIPLTLWDRKQGAKSEASFLEKSAEFNLEDTRLDLTREANAAYQRYVSAKESLHLFQNSILEEARAAAESARLAFESGPFRFLDLIDAQRTYVEATLEYYNDMHELRLAEIELMVSLGISFPGGVE